MNAPTRVVTAHLPVGLADKLDEIAVRSDRARGWIVKQAVAAWVDQEEERHKMTLDALASVDAGRVIDHRDVVAWIESLGTDEPLPPPSA